MSTIVFDDRLGWTYHPDLIWNNSAFSVNSAGFRSRREHSEQPLPDTLRIATFGDSFAAGYEVRDEEVWSHYLEQGLNQAGIRTEVLNFGVSA